ncbi:transmembrane protein 200A-like [Scyliorhinus canicula]|uniref:transmembrane protein 200A-like n=1 Tax=Scyliorhinus canicula TaxID=7830 RepID=UPI0018F51905|nr:transmembrane protein 200A-like [Scyliorhinus canicula]
MTTTVEDPAIKSQENLSSQPDISSPPKIPQPKDRSRDNKDAKGKIKMRSPSGLFVILGLFIVMVGICLAVVGYWPHKRNSRVSVTHQGINSSESKVVTQHVKVKLQSNPVLKQEKFKLIGPLIMGFGLFIFICANTVLHENRDRETKLLAQTNIYSMVGQTCNGENREPKQIPSPTSTETNFRCLEQCCATEMACRAIHGHTSPQCIDCHRSVEPKMTAQLLHHQRPSPSVSLHSVQSDSCNSSERNLSIPLNCDTVSLISMPVVLPVIKLNNCIIDTPDTAVMEDIELHQKVVMVSTEDLSQLQSFGYVRSSSIRSADDATRGVDMDYSLPSKLFSTRLIGKLLSPVTTRKVYGSDMQLHTTCGYSKSFDLGKDANKLSEQKGEQKHRSWPRLDCNYIKKYLKLENREDSVDRLLEQVEREYASEEQNIQELSNPKE